MGSTDRLMGMISYIRDEIDRAENMSDVNEILLLLDSLLNQQACISPIQGLQNIRVEYTASSTSKHFNVTTNVPKSLVPTFYALSDRMNQLQIDDPVTFSNAASALFWIAHNDKNVG